MIPQLLSLALLLGGAPRIEATPLAQAIAAFNERAQRYDVGQSQPEVTEDEVISAIRWAAVHRQQYPVTDEEFAAYQHIAETHALPQGAEFEVISRFQPNGREEFTIWSVRIRMPRTDPRHPGSYAFIIRDQCISVRTLGPAERAVIDKWNRRGMGSFEREQYSKELRDAQEKDRKKQPWTHCNEPAGLQPSRPLWASRHPERAPYRHPEERGICFCARMRAGRSSRSLVPRDDNLVHFAAARADSLGCPLAGLCPLVHRLPLEVAGAYVDAAGADQAVIF